MSFPRILLTGSILLFSTIIVVSLLKSKKDKNFVEEPQEIAVQEIVINDPIKEVPKKKVEVVKTKDILPTANNIDSLFITAQAKHPIVETVSYTSRVPWLSGRPAWISDYASFYQTSRHFIARSLNKKVDYLTQKITPGDKFNVLRKDIDLSFYILIDLSRSKMWFYALNETDNHKYLLKTYSVGLGRKDSKRPSGCLTPLGKYSLGSKVAIYKNGTMGYFQDRKIEMIKIFGTRWIPFENEIENCSDDAKGFGIHGTPWVNKKSSPTLVEDQSKIGQYDSDGCIRLISDDIEELFSIIITKPTVVELVKDYNDSQFVKSEIR